MAETSSPTSPAASAAAQDEIAATGLGAAAAGTAAATEVAGAPDIALNTVSGLAAEQRETLARTANDSALIELREQRKALTKQRAELARRMKTEQKKKSRLLQKAEKLSNNELLEVFAARVKRNEARAPGSAAEAPQGERP